MNVHDATEQAYKNGYEKGVKTFVNKLKVEIVKNASDSYYNKRSFGEFDVLCVINNLLKETVE